MALLRHPLIAPSALMDPRENCIDLSQNDASLSLIPCRLYLFFFVFVAVVCLHRLCPDPPSLQRYPFFTFIDPDEACSRLYPSSREKGSSNSWKQSFCEEKIGFWSNDLTMSGIFKLLFWDCKQEWAKDGFALLFALLWKKGWKCDTIFLI